MAGCSVTFLKTQDASKSTHGRGVRTDSTTTLGAQSSSQVNPKVIRTQLTSYAAQSVDGSQKTFEDPGVQIRWAFQLKGDWDDTKGYTCPSPEAPAAGAGPIPAAGEGGIPVAGEFS